MMDRLSRMQTDLNFTLAGSYTKTENSLPVREQTSPHWQGI